MGTMRVLEGYYKGIIRNVDGYYIGTIGVL